VKQTTSEGFLALSIIEKGGGEVREEGREGGREHGATACIAYNSRVNFKEISPGGFLALSIREGGGEEVKEGGRQGNGHAFGAHGARSR